MTSRAKASSRSRRASACRRRRRRRTAARCPGRWRTSARRAPRCRARASTSRCRRGRGAPATRSIARRDSASLSAAIVRVSGSAPTPCASRFCVSRRMSSPARFSLSIVSAACSPSITCRIDTRCSAKRSRSLTTPRSRPFSTTTIWRTPRSAITCIASYAVADAGQRDDRRASSPRPAASSSGRPGSTTRRSRSTSVNMPTGAPSRVERDDRAHLGVGHLLRGLAQRRGRRAGDRRIADELGERARQRLLLGRALAVLAVAGSPATACSVSVIACVQ